jgi:hypothetical protein
LGAVFSGFGNEVFPIVSGFKPLVVAVGIGGQLHAGKGFGVPRNAAVGRHAGDESDLHAESNELLGELKTWVKVALRRERH